MKTVTKLGATAVIALVASLLTWTAPAHAQGGQPPTSTGTEARAASRLTEPNFISMPDGTLYDASTLTEADWNTAVEELIASDIPRTVQETASERLYFFHVPVDKHLVRTGEFTLTIAAPAGDGAAPRLGAGSDKAGVYVLLNSFDQNLIISGAGAAVTAALCAIPAIGWVSCAAITAAIVVAATWLAVHGTCPGNLKAYIFIPERNSCVR